MNGVKPNCGEAIFNNLTCENFLSGGGLSLTTSIGTDCTCVAVQPDENCNFENYRLGDAEPLAYNFELCPSFHGGINFVGCEKWLRAWIDGDSHFNTATGAYEVYPTSGDICLDENNQVYDVLSEHISQFDTSLVFYDVNGLPTGTGLLTPDYWLFQ